MEAKCVSWGVLALVLLAAVPGHTTVNPSPKIRTADSKAVDAFGRWRVSNPSSQLHIEQYYDKNPLLLDEELGGTGTATFQTGEASTLLATAANSDFAIQQSYNHGQYQAGQSQQIKMTFAEFATASGFTKRVGYFHCNATTPFASSCDGWWLSSEEGTVYLNIYRNGTEIDRTAQSAWDDPLDGTGPSGVTVSDWDLAQILLIDFQFLGVGRTRWGFIFGGEYVQVHTHDHANVVDKPYVSNPNQPIRWEIRQTGAGSDTLRSICAEVSTEGPLEFIGTTRSASNGTTEVSMSADTNYAILGLTIQNSKDHLSIIPTGWSALATSANDEFEWRLCLNPTVADTFTYNAVTGSPAAVAIGVAANTVSDCTATDGKQLSSGYGTAGAIVTIPGVLRRPLGHTIDGVDDKIVLVIRPFASANVAGSLTWEERY